MAWKNEREIHINGKAWAWKVSSSRAYTGDWDDCYERPHSKVAYIRSPDGSVYTIKRNDLDPDSLEIKPSIIKEYIQRNIIESEE